MLRRLIFLPAVAVGIATSAAAASEAPDSWRRAPIPKADTQGQIQLAQYRDAEVYYDGNGNRVIVDSVTGEVIAVQPRRLNAQRERLQERRREIRRQDRYYLDDPEDMARLRRDEARERRAREYLPDDGYSAPDWDYVEPEYSDRGYQAPRQDSDFNTFPEAPPPARQERRVPEVARNEPIAREPLSQPGAGDPATTGTIEPQGNPVTENPAAAPALNFTAREDVAALQILLDRAGASPGVIDGKFGSNVDKALAAYVELTGNNLKSTDSAGIKAALAASGGDALGLYEITPEDAAGPYVASVPTDYSEKAKLDHMSFTSVTEMLAERFHMDEAYLKSLNPEANFSRPGTRVRVANFGTTVSTKVQRIIADKGRKQVRAYDAGGKLVASSGKLPYIWCR